MKILLVSQYYPPEGAAGGIRASEMAYHWANQGHCVTVLTGFPSYPEGMVYPEYKSRRRLVLKEVDRGVNVVRVRTLTRPNRGALDRLLNYGSLSVAASLVGPFCEHPDVVVATSPPPFVALAGWWIGFLKRVPFVYDVRDLWPEILVEAGVAGERSVLVRGLRAMVGFLYRRAAHIVSVSPAFVPSLTDDWKMPKEKISVVENGIEPEVFCPGPALDKADLGGDGDFVVSYLGTLGKASGGGLEVVLLAAQELQQKGEAVRFAFVGGGSDAECLKAMARDLHLTNVVFLGVQPRQRVPSLLRSSDAVLVILRKLELFKTVIPTKMLEGMACGRPVIIAVDGHARSIVESAHGGIFVEPENVDQLVQAIRRLRCDRALCAEQGANGRAYVVLHFSRASMANRFIAILEKVISPKVPRPRLPEPGSAVFGDD